MTENFEQLVATIPDGILLTEAEAGELIVLARSADREALRARRGEQGHELGTTMARFLVRFTELLGASSPGTVEQMVTELREAIADADADALDAHRRGLE
jgi:hypothetical protein